MRGRLVAFGKWKYFCYWNKRTEHIDLFLPFKKRNKRFLIEENESDSKEYWVNGKDFKVSQTSSVDYIVFIDKVEPQIVVIKEGITEKVYQFLNPFS